MYVVGCVDAGSLVGLGRGGEVEVEVGESRREGIKERGNTWVIE